MNRKLIASFIFVVASFTLWGQGQDTLLKPERLLNRPLRYKPDNGDFVIFNGDKRFTRALYGNNTAFRMEAGDLPEFAFYLPGFGGTVKMGIAAGTASKWLSDARSIEARYRPGAMIYRISDPLMGAGRITITAIGLDDSDGGIVRVDFENIPEGIQLIVAYGGASGKRFSRNGDLKVDPADVFFLKEKNCKDNRFIIDKNSFKNSFGNKGLSMQGVWPGQMQLKLADAGQMHSPLHLINSDVNAEAPLLVGTVEAKNTSLYFLFQNPKVCKDSTLTYDALANVFYKADAYRESIAGRVQVATPDSFINTLGSTLAVAADAIWENPSWMHGAVGWRMRLNGWRGPYAGDPLGWHDRARTHFSAYAQSQVTTPDSGPSIADSSKNYARQLEKMGTALFTSGYVCRNPGGDFRPNHYDMNLVYVDALLRHFLWTGDTAYIRSMWPVLKRHFAWERRNFDADSDGLYDAYCCIWASDALEYSGGGVAHSSAYNYYANLMAAKFAVRIGEDPTPFQNEANRILKAMNSKLWMPYKGWYAEYQDYLGLKRLHPSAALWTVYHTIDSEVPDAFQAYQLSRYLDEHMPHISVMSSGIRNDGAYVLATSNWMPYEWSINNVVMAESLHGALSLWQSGRADDAFRLWKGAILDAMFLGSSPGNFVQTSYYDAFCGEAYRDFADEIGIGARSLVEGLFGIVPDLTDSSVYITPGFPAAWDSASLKIPDVSFRFKRNGTTDSFRFSHSFTKKINCYLRLKATSDSIADITFNGAPARWKVLDKSVGNPVVEIEMPRVASSVDVTVLVRWVGNAPETLNEQKLARGEKIKMDVRKAQIVDVYDPQGILLRMSRNQRQLQSTIEGDTGAHTFFVKLRQKQMQWWAPQSVQIVNPLELITNGHTFQIKNNTTTKQKVYVELNSGSKKSQTFKMKVDANMASEVLTIPDSKRMFGTSRVVVSTSAGFKETERWTNWDSVVDKSSKYETINLQPYFNDKVTQIFKNEYLSPRCPYPTLSIPKQGIGDWCSTAKTAKIDDSGLRASTAATGIFSLSQGIPFVSPSKSDEKNILFTSLWDNYPDSATVSLQGKASHAFLLMAGSTNHMQSRMVNAVVRFVYTDGSADSLELRNPENWWPIEQNYFTDNYAFRLNSPKPPRVYLKTGTIKIGGSNQIKNTIDGGAATVLDLPLDRRKELQKMVLKTVANEVVVGVMAITLVR
jgi:hypothetical protein